MSGVVLRRAKYNVITQGESHVTSEAKMGVMQLQSEKCQPLMVTTRSEGKARKDSTQSLRRSMTLRYLDIGLLASRIVKE